MSTGNVLMGAVIGIVAGAVLGVLFAPDKGSATRKRMSKRGAQEAGTLQSVAGDYFDSLEE